MKILIVGLGLIGGSILKALQNKDHELYGIDQNKAVLNSCFEQGLIVSKEVTFDVDLVFVCLYPEATVNFILEHQNLMNKGTIVTDVSGLKLPIIESLKGIRDDIHFIGGHPMAGREGSGFEQSDETIFVDANYLLTTHEDHERVHELVEIISSMGCGNIRVLSPEKHDEIIAYTSHMPHLLSTTFMNCNCFDETSDCIAGSFKDMTRVSDINAALWSELILNNRKPVLSEIKKFKHTIEALESMIDSNDQKALHDFLEEARKKKRAI